MTAAALGDARFVSLTTFRRTGEPVSTPVWVARDGDELLVLTPRDSGKVTRLRADPRVELRPCGRFGAVAPDAVVVRGAAQVVEDPGPARRAVAAKYPVEHRVVLGIERARGAGPPAAADAAADAAHPRRAVGPAPGHGRAPVRGTGARRAAVLQAGGQGQQLVAGLAGRGARAGPVEGLTGATGRDGARADAGAAEQAHQGLLYWSDTLYNAL